MQIKLAKKIVCNGDKLIGNYIARENELVTLNPLGHRPLQNIVFEEKIVETVKYKT